MEFYHGINFLSTEDREVVESSRTADVWLKKNRKQATNFTQGLLTNFSLDSSSVVICDRVPGETLVKALERTVPAVSLSR